MTSVWAAKATWPRDPAGYVFLGRAVHEVGRALFADAWTGDEPMTPFIQPLPEWPALAPLSGRARAHSLLSQVSPFTGGTQAARTPNALLEFTPEEWAVARALVDQQVSATTAPLYRFWSVQRDIVDACEVGDLVVALRPKEGGQMWIAPTIWWNTDRWTERFHCCQLNPKDPFSTGPGGEDYWWIFVSRSSLDEYVQARAVPSPETPGAPAEIHLSPYLRMMHHAVERLGVTPERQPKKAQVEAVLAELWPATIPPSRTLLQAMATLIREPDSQAGRARKTDVG